MQKRFQSVLHTFNEAPTPLFALLPFDPKKTWPTHSPVNSALRVKGTISAATNRRTNKNAEPGFFFSTAMLMRREDGYWLMITRKMQKAAGVGVGGMAEFVLEPDLETEVEAPPELAKLFKEDRSVKKWFEKLNYSNRKYIANQIAEPKSAEVRVRRAEEWVERMMLAMEGEEVVPPILQIAFRRQPLAREGWEKLTANRKRMLLLGIFSCKGTEARDKRVDYAIDEALRKAGLRTGRKASSKDEYDDF